METKANYVAVGAFVLACLLGTVVALLWLAGAQYSEEYAYYQTYFTGSVTGLGTGTAVRYNGIEMGRVSKLKFDPDNPKRVIAILQIDPNLKLHTDSIASIGSEGITGGAYVEIDGGTTSKPFLRRTSSEPYPVIKSRPSTLQQLAESAPRLIAKLNTVADQMSALLDRQNRENFDKILSNLRDTTDTVNKHSADIDATLHNLSQASRSLDGDLDQMHVVLGHVDNVAQSANGILNGGTVAQLDQLVTQSRELVTSLRRLSNDLERQPTRLLYGDRRKGYTPQ